MSDMENQFIAKAKFYQEMGLWPRTIKLNYSRWLDNFTDEEDWKIAEMFYNYVKLSLDEYADSVASAAVDGLF